MKCPNCGSESTGAQWCSTCGTQLTNGNNQNPQTQNFQTQNPQTFNANAEYSNMQGQNSGYANMQSPVAGNNNSGNNYSGNSSGQYGANQPYNGYDEVDPAQSIDIGGAYYGTSGKKSNKGLKITLVIVAVLTVLVVTFAALYLTGVIDFGSEDSKSTSDTPKAVLENEEVESLLENGKYYMSVGDYDAAETVYKTIIDKKADSGEAQTIYGILYNYNRAVKKLEVKKYEEARDFYNKIPHDYTDYSICDDVEALYDEILSFETMNARFEEFEKYMEDEDYEAALELSEEIDVAYLSDSDFAALQKHLKTIDSELNKEKPQKPQTPTTSNLSADQAYSIVYNYCQAYVDAVNYNDFSIVAPLLRGALYEDQKGMVKYWNDNRASMEFNYLDFIGVRSVGTDMWEIDVTESMIVLYADGTSEEFTSDWTYTAEATGMEVYLTNIEKMQ